MLIIVTLIIAIPFLLWALWKTWFIVFPWRKQCLVDYHNETNKHYYRIMWARPVWPKKRLDSLCIIGKSDAEWLLKYADRPTSHDSEFNDYSIHVFGKSFSIDTGITCSSFEDQVRSKQWSYEPI